MPSLLTTLERVKAQVFSGVDTDVGGRDELIEQLILYTSDRIERLCDRVFVAATYTEYRNGTGGDTLYLRQGPLVSVTTVQSVEYSDGGSGARSETLTTINPYEYVEGGQRDEGCTGAGFLRLLSSVFTVGKRNYKIVYNAGFVDDRDVGANNIPQALVSVATSYAAQLFNLRDLHGLASREVGAGDLHATIPMANLDQALLRGLSPFRILRFA